MAPVTVRRRPSRLPGGERTAAALVAAVLGVGVIGILAVTSRPPEEQGSLDDADLVIGPPDRATAPTSAPSVPAAARGTSSTQSSSRTDPIPATGAAPSPADVLEPSPGPNGGWLTLQASPALPEGTLEDIVYSDDVGYVAVGTDGTSPLVLRSEDGLRWTRVGTDEPRLSDVSGLVRGIALTREGLAVVGRSNGRPAVWTSTDGRAWDPVVVQGAAEGTVVLSAVAAGGGGLVVVGFDEQGTGFWRRGATELARVPAAEVDRLADGSQVVRDVAWLDGRFVAVGTSGPRAAVWTSPDGGRWRVEALEAGDDVVPVTIGTPDGAVGGYTGEGGAVWIRDDAGAWERMAMPLATASPQVVDAVAGAGRDLLAIGRDGRSARCWQRGVMAEGGGWRHCEQPMPDAQTVVRDLVRGRDRWVAVGTVLTERTPRPSVWVLG